MKYIKLKLILLTSFTVIVSMSISYKNRVERELIRNILESEYNPRTLITAKLEEVKKEKLRQDRYLEFRKSIVEFKNSDYYKLRESTRYWRLPLGIDTNQLKPVTFKTTGYSSLPIDNGGYTVTCNGEPLEGNIVANNTLPQGTRIFMKGKIYTVADKGSSRFNNPYRLDVLISRNYGESDTQYRNRVFDYGVQHLPGYIIN